MSTKIEWCKETWNPVVGCTKVSEGCTNCYAERMAYRLACMGRKPYTDGVVAGEGEDGGAMRGRWTGKIGIAAGSTWLKPLHWKKPRMIFVCSMGDLFHANVFGIEIWTVLEMVRRCPRHTFLFLTKQPANLRGFLKWYYDHETIESPIPNLWLGVTAENQEAADERIPILLDTPASVRFISHEPSLGALNPDLDGIDWVICGGESGPGARPMHPDWARSLRDQCQAAGVPFFMKQMSGKTKAERHAIPDDLMIREYPEARK